ncbi:MAG: hypothetical protein QF733_07535 [Phycisphaerales bacterium]|jgi:hypothetical protein|nr:hypothetical protein [Phycisphaerales bacterium]
MHRSTYLSLLTLLTAASVAWAGRIGTQRTTPTAPAGIAARMARPAPDRALPPSDPQLEERLVGSDLADRFGFSLDLFGDRLLVGIPGQSTASPEHGGVDGFRPATVGGWTPDALNASVSPAEGDRLGYAIDVDGDLQDAYTAVVGAPGTDWFVDDSTGAVYLWEDTSGAWSLKHRLDPFDLDGDQPAQAADIFAAAEVDPIGGEFGRSVAIDGDLIAVGMPYASAAPSLGAPLLQEAGAVVVYRRESGQWELDAVIARADTRACADDIHQLDYFGASVALHGDHLVVGTPLADDPRMTETGACYVDSAPTDGIWDIQLDTSEDACNTLALGGDAVWLPGQTVTNPLIDTTTLDSLDGACCYYTSEYQCQWMDPASPVPPTLMSQQDCELVYDGVWIQGQDPADIDCPIEDNTHLTDNVGVVDVFRRDAASDSWIHLTTLRPPQDASLAFDYATPESWFGHSVAMSGSTIAVGQPGWSRPLEADPWEAGGRGMAWAFERFDAQDTAWSVVTALDPNIANPPLCTLVAPLSDGARYGWSIDVTACHIAVGAPGGDYSIASEEGGVYIWDHLDHGQWSHPTTINPGVPACDDYNDFNPPLSPVHFVQSAVGTPGDQWGRDVAVRDRVLMMGGWLYDTIEADVGAAERWMLDCPCQAPSGPDDDCDEDGCSDVWQISVDPTLDRGGSCSVLDSNGYPAPDGLLDVCQMGKHPAAITLSAAERGLATGHTHAYTINSIDAPATEETWNEARNDPIIRHTAGVELASLSRFLEAYFVDIRLDWDFAVDGSLWLGGYDDPPWTWVDGEAWFWDAWLPGEPGLGADLQLLASEDDVTWTWSAGTLATGGHLIEFDSDCNSNDLLDAWDIRAALIEDGVILDCDDDCRIDSCQIEDGTRADCNGNGIPDRCDLSTGQSQDCNGNDVPDTCDVTSGFSDDCNANDIPDECDTPADLQICDAIVINEVLVAPASDANGDGVFSATEDQCVEIVNNSAVDINLLNWAVLLDGTTPWHEFSSSITIEAHCAILIFGGGSPDDAIFPDGIQVLTATNGQFVQLPVPDTGATNTLSLRDDFGDEQDNVTWGPDASAGGASMARCPDVFGDAVLIPHDDCTSHLMSLGLHVDLTQFPCSEIDTDGDGVPDADDNCPNTQNADQDDCDADGIGDACDTVTDCDFNGVDDLCQILGNPALDCDANGIIDVCDVIGDGTADCNDNGILDTCELDGAPSIDCDDNGIIDTCDIVDGTHVDCNGNSIPDSCDILNGVPDCNTNGVPDACDILDGTSLDLNGDGVPDECEFLDPCDLDNDGTPEDLVSGTLMIISYFGCPSAPECPVGYTGQGDYDEDGDVDVDDMLGFTQNPDCTE